MGKFIILAGIFIVVIGLVVLLLEKSGGRLLPGDIYIRRGNFTFFFPIVTSIIISIVLTLIMWLAASMRR